MNKNLDGTPWSLLELTVDTVKPDLYAGTLQLKTSSRKDAETHRWSAARREDGWEVTGQGAFKMNGKDRMPNPSQFPFTLNATANSLLISALVAFVKCDLKAKDDAIAAPPVPPIEPDTGTNGHAVLPEPQPAEPAPAPADAPMKRRRRYPKVRKPVGLDPITPETILAALKRSAAEIRFMDSLSEAEIRKLYVEMMNSGDYRSALAKMRSISNFWFALEQNIRRIIRFS